jgi:hypothetical protein
MSSRKHVRKPSHESKPKPPIYRRAVAAVIGGTLLAAIAGAPYTDHKVHEDLRAQYGNEREANPKWNPYAIIASGIASHITSKALRNNKDLARDLIANQRYQKPRITEVTDIGSSTQGHDTVKLKISLPENSLAQTAMVDYATSNAVNWQQQPELTSYAISQTSKGAYRIAGPGFEQVADEILDVNPDNIASIEVNPFTFDRLGTTIALFVTNNANTERNGNFIETTGQEYLGSLTLADRDGHRRWVSAPKISLPDVTNTSVSAPEN